MKIDNLRNMTKGWFIGNFSPSLYLTNDVEVAVKRYKASDHESSHYHKVATEYTVIIEGEVEMNGVRYYANDIIVMEPGETTDFTAITDSINVVVKIPGVNNDKYLVEEE